VFSVQCSVFSVLQVRYYESPKRFRGNTALDSVDVVNII